MGLGSAGLDAERVPMRRMSRKHASPLVLSNGGHQRYKVTDRGGCNSYTPISRNIFNSSSATPGAGAHNRRHDGGMHSVATAGTSAAAFGATQSSFDPGGQTPWHTHR